MRKITVLLAILIIVFTSLVIAMNYSQEQPYFHSQTKAICTPNNFCQDYEIFCENKQVIKISPITGAVVQFDRAWQDPRSEKQKKLC